MRARRASTSCDEAVSVVLTVSAADHVCVVLSVPLDRAGSSRAEFRMNAATKGLSRPNAASPMPSLRQVRSPRHTAFPHSSSIRFVAINLHDNSDS